MYLYYTISGLFNALASTILGFLVYRKSKDSKANKIFALLCFGFAAWSYPYAMWPLAQTREETLFWFQVLHYGAIFIPIFYYHFVLTWLEIKNKKLLWMLYIGYGLAVFFCFFVFTPLFITDMVPKFSMRWWAEPGIVYYWYLLYFFFFYIFSSLLLLFEYHKANGIKKSQIKFVLIGIVIAIAGGSTNYILWFNINIPPYGNIFASTYIIFTGYAILKHHLFNIKVIATELFAFFISVVLLIDALISKSQSEFILKFIIFLGGSVLGVLLIRGVLKEIKSAEKIKELADDLAKVNKTLKSANRELKRLDDAKSEFLSIASHQLRTPLTAIKGLSSMLVDGDFGKIDDEPKDAVKNIFLSSERMNKLVNNLLNISRIEGGRLKYNFEKKDLDEIVKDVVNELMPVAQQRGLTLNLKCAENLPQVSVDLEKIRQVILNYIDNSIKYTESGMIDIKLEKMKWSNLKVALKKSYQFELNKKLISQHKINDGDFVKFTVQDKGRGISKDDQRRLFQKFSRGTGVSTVHTEGTGLGLYVCRKMIEAHSGFFWVESAGEGKGSKFSFAVKVDG